MVFASYEYKAHLGGHFLCLYSPLARVFFRPKKGNMNILRIPNTAQKIGLSKSAIYDRLDQNSPRYDATFPRPVTLGSNKNSSIGFIESELNDWLNSLSEKRK